MDSMNTQDRLDLEATREATRETRALSAIGELDGSGKEDAMLIAVDAYVHEAAAMLGCVTSAVAAAMAERNRDFIDHHKKTVLKGLRFKAGDRARRMIASRMFGYAQVADVLRTGKIEDAKGESFVASREDVPQLTAKAILTFERGGQVQGSGFMAVPIGDGLPYKGAFATRPIWQGRNGQDLLEESRRAAASGGVPRFVMRYSPLAKRILIFDRGNTRTQRANARSRMPGQALPMTLVGMLTRRRMQPAKMGVMAAASKILPKHMAKLDEAVSLATTAAGQQELALRTISTIAARRAYSQTFRDYLEMNPERFAAAKKAARQARSMVKAARIVKGD
jgi:hypothetical protein